MSKFEKEILKIGRHIVYVLLNMQNVAISRCCFVTFCKQRQRNEQRILYNNQINARALIGQSAMGY